MRLPGTPAANPGHMRLLVLATLLMTACNAPSAADDENAAALTGDDATAGWIFDQRAYMNEADAQLLTDPDAAEGRIQGLACDPAEDCLVRYYHGATAGGTSDTAVRSFWVVLDEEGANCDGQRTTLDGRLDVIVASDGLGGSEYPYTYRFRYTCLTQELAFGRGVPSDVLTRSH